MPATSFELMNCDCTHVQNILEWASQTHLNSKKHVCIMQLMRHTTFAICVHNSFRCMIIAFICVIIHFQIVPDSRASERNEQICLVHTTSTRFIVERKAVLALERIHCSDWKKVISFFFHSSSSKAFTNPLLD